MDFIFEKSQLTVCLEKNLAMDSIILKVHDSKDSEIITACITSMISIMKLVKSLSDYYNSGIKYIIITSDPKIKEILFKVNARFMFYHKNEIIQAENENKNNIYEEIYLKTAYDLILMNDYETCEYTNNHIKYDNIPRIGFYSNPHTCSSGVLPVVCYNNEIFCLLGIDKRLLKYSDFGGRFDALYTKHRRDSYKNNILQNKQIQNGFIDNDILSDHRATLNSSDNNKYIHPNYFEYMSGTGSNYALGYGDVNTKYTALRELMEETSYIDNNGDVGYIFNLDMIIKKLYKDHAYMYLGGNKQYDYDMYVVFLTIDDLSNEIATWFINLYDQYKLFPKKYINKRIDNIKSNEYFNIPNNMEMMGIDMIPLNDIVSDTRITTNINISADANIDITANNQINNNIKIQKIINTKSLLSMMRLSFADALIKYHKDFEFIADSFTFDKIKALFNLIII